MMLTTAEQKTLDRLSNVGFTPYGLFGLDKENSVICHACLCELEVSLKAVQPMTEEEYNNQTEYSTDSINMSYLVHPVSLHSGEGIGDNEDGEYCDYCNRLLNE